MNPKGHAALVTGGASGLGEGTAMKLAAAGAKVTILDMNMDLARAVADKIGGHAEHCDVSDEASTIAAIKGARDKHGVARILVNCAGIGGAMRIVGKEGPMPLAHFEKVIKVNLVGTFNATRLFAANLQNDRAVGGRRARRCHHDRICCGFRRPDWSGGLCVVEGRRRAR